MHSISILIITGPVGVGKTKTSDAVSDLLTNQSISNAVIDMDSLRWAYPRSDTDPFNEELGLKNLSSIWPNYVELGVTHVIIPNVVESTNDIRKIETLIPNSSIYTIRLSANDEILHQRLENREAGISLKWHKKRALELNKQFSENEIADAVIETDNKTVEQVAESIMNVWKI